MNFKSIAELIEYVEKEAKRRIEKRMTHNNINSENEIRKERNTYLHLRH